MSALSWVFLISGGAALVGVVLYGLAERWSGLEEVGLTVAIVAGVVAGSSGLGTLIAAWDSNECRVTAETMNAEWSWGWRTECMVKVGERWIPLSNYRGTEDQ